MSMQFDNVTSPLFTNILVNGLVVMRVHQDGSVELPNGPLVGAQPTIHVRDVKPSGADGGSFISGSWQTRDLNTVVTNTIAGATLSGNQVTLPAGTYEVQGIAPHFQTGSTTPHQARARLYNVTAGVPLAAGTPTRINGSGAAAQLHSPVQGRFTLSATSVVALQHYTGQTKNTDGLGQAMSMGDPEIYSDLVIRKVK